MFAIKSELNNHGEKIHDDPTLKLACVGNCAYSCLIDEKAQVVWSCFPRFDGDPIFCSLLKRSTSTTNDIGFFDIHLNNFERSEQKYLRNSAVLSTTMYDKFGNALEIIDFIPKFESYERPYNPYMFIRKLIPKHGRPRVQIRLRPTFGYGWGTPEKSRGSNHIRYLLSNMSIRLTTNCPISFIVDEVFF
jgi:GH15 family glucan-1,4-alpha-glucosidase